MSENPRFLEFGGFRLDRRERLLWRGEEQVALPPKAADLLVALADEPGELRTKDELMTRVWPDVVVDESNLTQNIFLLRKALDDDGTRWIVTVPRRGYRFVGNVSAPDRRTRVAVPHWIAIAVIVVAAIWFAWSRIENRNRMRSIAVLPFQCVGCSDRILQLGMADTLINKLSTIPDLVITPTHAVTPYLDSRVDALRAGHDLGVNAVIEGNLQREGHRIRCTVRLLRVGDGRALWADQYDEEESDLFDLEDRIAGRVLSALDVRLSPEQKTSLTRRYTSNREAYALYLRGRLAWETFQKDGLEESVRYFDAALDLDPHYAPAYAGLGKTYSVMAIYGVLEPEEAWRRSRDVTVRALEIDPQYAEAHTSLAAEAIFHDWNWTMADAETRKAIELDPVSDGHTLRGYYLQAVGRPAEALVELRKEREIDPLWVGGQSDWIVGLYLARRYDDAVRDGLQLLKLQPRHTTVRYYVGKSLRMLGRLDEAAVQQQACVQQQPDFVRSIAELGVISAQRGDRAGARARVDQLQTLRTSDILRRSNYLLASVHASLGDRDAAFAALEDAYKERYPFLWQVRTDAAYDSLRGDPRFAVFLKKLNLR